MWVFLTTGETLFLSLKSSTLQPNRDKKSLSFVYDRLTRQTVVTRTGL